MTPIAHPLTQLFAGLVVALALVACGGDEASPPPPTEGSATIGPAGGTVTGPDGVKLALPPEALETDTTFRIARDGSGAPPLPAGIDLASAVYAITPHGGAFGASASVELPVSAALAAGRPTFLMKANPGGRWAVIGSGATGATTLRAGIDSLSYLAVGACQDNLPAGSPLAQACPSSHRLSLELLINGTTPVPISQDTTYGAPIPVLLVTTPETLTFRMTWTRPAGTNRVDALDTGTSLSANSLVRNAGFTFSPTAPRFQDVNENSFSRIFTVDVDPARVSGASGPTGVVRRIWAQAAYAFTGPGNVGSANWEFTAWVPIQVRSLVPVVLPVITTQPADTSVSQGQTAGFGVSASISPASALTYQWSRSSGPGAALTAIPGATASSYNIASATLADDGAQFQVQVCAEPTRCVLSNVATLSVVAATSAPVFTTSPVDQMVVEGQTASLNAVATGAPLPGIRWQRAPAGTSNFADITGVPACAPTNPTTGAPNVAASCTVGPLAVGDSGQRYRAVATSTAAPGGVTSGFATVLVSAAAMAPSITQQPAPQSTTVGGSASFSVVASGTAPLNHVWQQGGNNLPSVSGAFNAGGCSGTVTYGNGGSTITLTGLSAGCNGVQVGVTVSNGINPSAVSNSVTLTVNPAATPGACFGGQSSWCYANPQPQAGALIGLTYNASTFTAVGESGTTLLTGDAGTTWQLAFEAGRTYFTDVASPAPGLLVAAGLPPQGSGQNAGVFTSTNGGGTWTRRLDAGFPGEFSVTKLAFANAAVGVAAGHRGLWRTTNGGVTWTAVPNVPDASFVVSSLFGGVTWVDTNVVLIYGAGGKILRSTDQGVNWTDVSPAGFSENWVDMAFNATGAGIAVGPGGRVARSTNGGASWQELVTPLSEPGTAVAFADANTVVVMGNIGQTMRSTDAGATWTTGFAFSASAFYRLRFASPTVGLAVSAISGLTLRTSDGGQTWTRIGGGTIDENVIGMAASPSGNVVLVGSQGRDMIRSTDGGATWVRPGFSPVGHQFQRPSFATEQRVIAIRPAGQIALSVNAGQTWSIAYDRLGQVGLANTMASASVGIVVGDNGLILRSTDGGSTWATVASGTTLPLKSVGCLTATLCLAGGFDGVLLRSTDGGATWSVARVPVTAGGSQIRTISRINDTTAVLAVDDGLWRSADAGLTWTRVYVPTVGSQLGVSFSAAGVGIATGYDGLLRSTDQGVTWVVQPVPAPSYLNVVTWTGATTVLVGGDGGAILRNLQAGAP